MCMIHAISDLKQSDGSVLGPEQTLNHHHLGLFGRILGVLPSLLLELDTACVLALETLLLCIAVKAVIESAGLLLHTS